MAEVLVVGDAIIDFVFADIDRYPDPGEELIAPRYELRPAGSAGYAAAGLGALDEAVSVSTVVGDDLLSDHWIEFVTSCGVDTSHVTRLEDERVSAAAAFLFPGERSFVTYRGANTVDTTPVPSPEGYDAVLVTGYSQAPYLWNRELLAFCWEADRLDIPVYLDTNWSEGGWQSTRS